MHSFLLAWSAAQHNATIDEIGHLAGGIALWEAGRFDVYRVNPPLVRAVAAAPVVLGGARSDWSAYRNGPHDRAEWTMGSALVRASGPEGAYQAFVLARWACIPFSLVGAWVCFRWARDLYGSGAGLLAMTLWCFCPNVIGHGQLITPDVGAASLGALAGYVFWRWLRAPDWGSAFLAGLGLGLAELTKFTWIVLFLVWPIVWLIWRQPRPRTDVAGIPTGAAPATGESSAPPARTRPREAMQLAVILFLGLYLTNAGYGFEGSFKRLDDFDFVSPTLMGTASQEQDFQATGNRFRGTWAGAIPAPLPANYVLGIDLQKLDFDRGKWSYLGGQWRFGGWWLYYLYAMAVKVPLGTWLLACLAIAATLFARGYSASPRDEITLLAPAIAVLGVVSAETGFSHHMRYVLPAFPFVFIWISKAARAFDLRHRGTAVFATMAFAWSVASSLSVFPHNLAYFNELAGGPANGHAHLLDSNIDWGQDLFFLKRWLDVHPEARPIGLAYFGSYPPEFAGILATQVPQLPGTHHHHDAATQEAEGPRPGWYAVSVNLLHGHIMGGWRVLPDYTYFLRLEPVAMAGYSIYIYHVTREEADRVRRELGLPELGDER